MKVPSDMTATEAAGRISDGSLAPAELVEACLDRIASREPSLKAFVHLDVSGARAKARETTAKPKGSLAGLPLAIKDVLDTCDMPAAYGSPIWRGHRPTADAAVVALAKQAGAIPLGKTATTEFATKFPAATVNPVNPRHTPGGSSSGSAAAVAAHLCPLAFATQTAGSIIRPAAFCGVVGYKPTFGTLHRAGMKVMSEELDTIGVIARTVDDCAFFIAALTGRPFESPDDRLARPPRLALILEPVEALADHMHRRMLEAADAARRAGAQVDEIALPQDLRAAHRVHPIVMNGEIFQALTWERMTQWNLLSPTLREVMTCAGQRPPTSVVEGRRTLHRARMRFEAMMADYDAIIAPSAPGEAPPGLENTGDPTFNVLWTALHAPVVGVPAGTGPNGLPLGLQIVAKAGDDASALRIARWMQAAMA